jgi:hypothetical protein
LAVGKTEGRGQRGELAIDSWQKAKRAESRRESWQLTVESWQKGKVSRRQKGELAIDS